MSTIKKLCYACVDGDDQEVQTILSRGDLDINTKYGDSTPLHYAMFNNHPSIVRMLLARADTRLDVTDSVGYTGLHWACRRNNPECVSLYGEDRRCSAQLLNLKNNAGNTPVMLAVERGHLECVREMEKLAGVDFETRNSQGETMIEVARRCDHHQIVQFLEMRIDQPDMRGAQAEIRGAHADRDAPHVAADVASNTLDNRSLTEIAEELASIEAIGSVMESEIDILEEKHREEMNRNIVQNKARQDDLKRRMQDRLNSSTSTAPPAPQAIVIPECPACLEEMRPPLQIFNCRNGHFICSVCRPSVSICTMCRMEYMGRATGVEQMIRQMVGQQ